MPLRQITPEKLEVRYSDSGRVAIGVLILAVGAGFGLYAAALPPRPPAPFNSDTLGSGIFAALYSFCGIGFMWMGSSRWIELDRQTKRIARRWGILVPLTCRVTDLAPFTAVQLDSKRGRGGTCYRVWLTGNATDLRLEFLWSAVDAMSDAKAIASFLGLPLNDLTDPKDGAFQTQK